MGVGRLLIKSDSVDCVLVGGAEAPLTPSLFSAFDRLGILPVNWNDAPHLASRPFDVSREGPVLGEGAVVMVLESERSLLARDGRALAEFVGYGATCDALSHFSQEPGGAEAVRAVKLALEMGCSAIGDVEYINAHGTGTRDNDPFETLVLRAVFGEAIERVPVSSSKSQFGHLLGAAPAIEAAAVVVAMCGGFVPVTLNLREPDVQCSLRHVMDKPIIREIQLALSTSFGFGSRNAAILLRHCGESLR